MLFAFCIKKICKFQQNFLILHLILLKMNANTTHINDKTTGLFYEKESLRCVWSVRGRRFNKENLADSEKSRNFAKEKANNAKMVCELFGFLTCLYMTQDMANEIIQQQNEPKGAAISIGLYEFSYFAEAKSKAIGNDHQPLTTDQNKDWLFANYVYNSQHAELAKLE